MATGISPAGGYPGRLRGTEGHQTHDRSRDAGVCLHPLHLGHWRLVGLRDPGGLAVLAGDERRLTATAAWTQILPLLLQVEFCAWRIVSKSRRYY